MTPNRIYIKDQSAIPLGMQGDGNVREIVFTPPEGLADKAWTASHQRATDPEPYPVALRVKDSDLIWLVTAADTDIAGQGRLQLVCLDGEDQVLKTMVYRTYVSASLSAPGDAPDPVKPWYDELMRELADIGEIPPEEIEQAVQDYLTEHPITETDPTVPAWAKQPEKPTYTAEDVGALSADTLQAATDAALAQAKESGEFDGPKGQKGDTGAQGPKGDKGDPGSTPVKGVDYYTEADKQEIVDDVLEQIPTGGGDITLGLTGATVGQIAKITAVDAQGKPTAWEPVDMAGGGGGAWKKIAEQTTAEDADTDVWMLWDKDINGNQFVLDAFYCIIVPSFPDGTTIHGLRISLPDNVNYWLNDSVFKGGSIVVALCEVVSPEDYNTEPPAVRVTVSNTSGGHSAEQNGGAPAITKMWTNTKGRFISLPIDQIRICITGGCLSGTKVIIYGRTIE